MRLSHYLGIALVPAAAIFACGGDDEQNPNPGRPRDGEDGGPPLVIPGGELPDEQFPKELLEPYTGPPIDVYDNTPISYRQLKSRVARVFADTGIGGDTEAYFASKVQLLGGADFVTTFAEARTVTPDFLLALDGVAKDACARAATNKSGPFAGTDPATDAPGAAAIVAQLYDRMLLRTARPEEVSAGTDLVAKLAPISANKTEAWAGMCEALVRHPDSIFTLPPSVSLAEGAEKEKLGLIKLSQDLAGRLPTADEIATLAGKSINEKVDYYFGTQEFRDFYYHRLRLRTESNGTEETDEPANLWMYLVLNGAPLQELLTADYTVNGSMQRLRRGPEHGKSGVLTMPGFIKTKPGLPHYNYAARVMTDFMGQLFEVPPEIVAMRIPGGGVNSTVEPGSTCIACHGVLTPLQTQRSRWFDDGTYHEVDEGGQPIDDTDRNLVSDYPYKGKGMEGFSQIAIRKERFLRQTFQSQFLFFLGRQMRYAEDERTVYLQLWLKSFETNGNFRELIKVVANIPGYTGQ